MRFRIYKVGCFNPTQSFSSVGPLLSDAYKQSKGEGPERFVVLNFTELFDVTSIPKDTTSRIGKIVDSTTIKNSSTDTEVSVILKLLVEVMVPIFTLVTLEKNKKYQKFGDLPAGLSSEHIGMGTAKTWHGTPDFRIGCVCMLSSDEFEFNETENISICSLHSTPSSTPARSPTWSICSTDFEGKKKIKMSNRDQLVATCVVSSFINKNLNNRNMTPAVLINGTKFIICLYDCENDILLLSDPIEYVKENGDLISLGLLALAIVVNHETSLLPNSYDASRYPSGIFSILKFSGHLRHYQDLNEKNVNVCNIKLSVTELSTGVTEVVSAEKKEEQNVVCPRSLRKRRHSNDTDGDTKMAKST